MVIWTGLALSPGFNSVFPAAVNVLGGRQSARTLHFFVSSILFLFLIVHVAMIILAGFWARMRAMITGVAIVPEQGALGQSAFEPSASKRRTKEETV
jgi:thiosulfate reductase cytochrome b subunit